MKKIMILGAGIYQVPLIRKAKEMGLYTIVVSIAGKYPGFEIADKIYYKDTADYNSVLPIARAEKIDGIVTAGTDVAVITVGKVCDEMGLCGLSFEAAQISGNKFLMKERYAKFGIRTAKFRKISFNDVFVLDKLADLKPPLMFKAVDSSGSRGIIRVDTPTQYAETIQKVKEYTKKDYFIAEEFLEGEEFGAQAFILNGTIEFILPHGDYVFQGDTGVPVGHWVPFELKDEIIEDAKQQLQLAAKAMGLDNCAMNVDFILVDGKPYVLEIGGRSGATCLCEMVSVYYQFDYYEKILKVALGEKPDFLSSSMVPCAAKLLYSGKDGIITSQVNNNSLSDHDIIEVQFDYEIGDRVSRFRIGPHRIGHVIVTGDTLDASIQKLDNSIKNITITIEQE